MMQSQTVLAVHFRTHATGVSYGLCPSGPYAGGTLVILPEGEPDPCDWPGHMPHFWWHLYVQHGCQPPGESPEHTKSVSSPLSTLCSLGTYSCHLPCRAYLGDASFESDVVESLMQALAEDEGNDEVSAQAAAPKVSAK